MGLRNTPQRRKRRLQAGIALAAAILLSAAVLAMIAFEQRRETAVLELRDHIAAQQAAPHSQADALSPGDAPAQTLSVSPAQTKSDDTDPWQAMLAQLEEMHGSGVMWGNWHDIFYDKSLSERTAEDWEAAARILQEHDALLTEARRLLEAGVPFPSGDSAKFGATRTLARLLSQQAFLDAHTGDLDASLDNVLAVWRVGTVQQEGASVIARLLGFAIESIALESLEYGIPPGELSSQQVRRIVDALATMDYQRALKESLFTNAEEDLESFSRIRGGENILAENPHQRTRITGFLYSTPFARPWVRLDEAAYAGIKGRILAAADLPYYEARGEIHAITEDQSRLPRSRVMTRYVLGHVPTLFELTARYQTLQELAQLGLLVEHHYAQQGVYPEQLDAVAPALGREIPVDPFTGLPYRYEISGDGFQLYSAGVNLQDNGGRHDFHEGDIVWRGSQ